MAYRAYPSDRRFRRRRWLLIIVSLVAIIAVIAILVSRRTEQRGAVEFFAAADESAAIHLKASAELESALEAIGLIDRQDLTRRLESVVEAAAEADELLDLEVPSGIGNSYGTMTVASTSWRVGTADLGRAIVGVMDGEDPVEEAQEQLQSALDLLRVGDVAYSVFLASLSDLPDDIEVPSFSEVTYINPDAQPLLYDAQTLVLRIVSSYVLSPHRDVAVSGMTVPEPIGESEGIPVVPFSESLDIQAVVSNVGNEDEPAVAVKLEIVEFDTKEAIADSELVTDLVAGSSTSVTFADVDIAPGGLYQVKVSVTIPEDIDPDNDVWEMTFIWKDES
jgi:hypothetical protein